MAIRMAAGRAFWFASAPEHLRGTWRARIQLRPGRAAHGMRPQAPATLGN